jgi:hypothetical protein
VQQRGGMRLPPDEIFIELIRRLDSRRVALNAPCGAEAVSANARRNLLILKPYFIYFVIPPTNPPPFLDLTC